MTEWPRLTLINAQGKNQGIIQSLSSILLLWLLLFFIIIILFLCPTPESLTSSTSEIYLSCKHQSPDPP